MRLATLRDDGTPSTFEIVVPGRYIVIGDRGPVRAIIDGVPVGRGVELRAGRHTVVAFDSISRPMVVWAGALRWAVVMQCRSCDVDHAEPFSFAR
ncbi:MAG: hypothetical protein M3P29_06000 [Acidobacteriota bacterium]|nr:hypothetical protein [Acidobacteriota bacterium]